MKEKYELILTKFGLSITAAKTYLALLELGNASADQLAKKVGTYKPNIYDALERLMDRGLVSYLFESKKKTYIPTNPQKLFDITEELKQKSLENFEELKTDLKSILPTLSASYENVSDKEIFEVYRGKDGYKAMIQDILREKPNYWKGFGNLQVQAFFPIQFQKWFNGIKIRLFSTKTDLVLQRLKEAKKVTEVELVWIPEDLQMPIVWTMFGKNLLIIIYEPSILVLRIKSKQIVDTFSNQFEYLWKKHQTLK